MDPITILIAGGLLGIGLGLCGSGKCRRCGRPMIESLYFWYSEVLTQSMAEGGVDRDA